MPAYRDGRQLPAGEAMSLKRAEVLPVVAPNGAGAPLDKQRSRPPRPCARCRRRFKPTATRWMLCAGCYKSESAWVE